MTRKNVEILASGDRRKRAWILSACLMVGAACTESSEALGEGSVDGSMLSDVATGGDAAMADAGLRVPACSYAIGECKTTPFGDEWGVLLEAKDFGAGTRLVAVGDNAVIMRTGSDGYRVAHLRIPATDPASGPFEAWTFSVPSGQVPVAITDVRGSVSLGDQVFVLTCAVDRRKCSVWQANDVENNGLSGLQEWPLPAEFIANGVAFDDYANRERTERHVCVYGSGLLCLVGEAWQAGIAFESGLRLNDVALGSPWSVAVGDNGRWFLRDFDENLEIRPWREQPALGQVKLSQVSVADAGAVVTGEGRVQAVLGTQADEFACVPEGELIALMLNHTLQGRAHAVIDGGRVLVQPGSPFTIEPDVFCSHRDFALQEEVIEVGVAPCNNSTGPRLLTGSALYGNADCLIID